MIELIAYGFALLVLLFSTIKLNKQWEEAVVLRLGKYSRTKTAGIFLMMPIFESLYRRDMRTKTMDVPKQEVITKDNISVSVDAVMWAKIKDSKKSVLNITNYEYAVRQFSQTTLRNVIGKKDLDEVLEKRDAVAQSIKEIVDRQADRWGVDIENIELQNIELPADMKRIMARQAEAEREKRAVIIKSEGELTASTNLRRASQELMKSGGAMELRRLATLSDVSQDQSNTIVFAVPLESLSTAMSASSGLQVPKVKTRKK